MVSFSLTTILAIVAYTAASAIPSDSLIPRDLKTCPALNNYIYTASSGGTTWRIRCNTDTVLDGDRVEEIETVSDLEACIKICNDANHRGWCKSVSFPGKVNDPSVCYLKGTGTGGLRERQTWKIAVKQ